MPDAAFLAVAATLFIAIVGAAWRLSGQITEGRTFYLENINKSERTQSEKIDAVKEKFSLELTNIRNEARIESDRLTRIINEPIFAIREHVSKMEIWMRDEFVSNKVYERDQDRLLLAFREQAETVKARLDTFDEKLSKIVISLAIINKGVPPSVDFDQA